jgi:hypothetical protein
MLEDDTSFDARTGTVRSLQRARVLMPEAALLEIWAPPYLERLARTYWRFLARITLGLVRVTYDAHERSLVLGLPALKLITFAKPEYSVSAERGVVRWQIERGLLVARAHRSAATRAQAVQHAGGHLQIVVQRLTGLPAPTGFARVEVAVEVANFYPAIAFALGRRLYEVTQSRVHVLVTRAFLRSLVRNAGARGVPDLARSKVGRLAGTGPRL